MRKGPKPIPATERFWPKVCMRGPDDCWEWLAGTNGRGYGFFYINGKQLLAHRVSWEMVNGSIPDGLDVLHDCDNGLCINPRHLHLGTQAQNAKEAVARGLMLSAGELNPNSKLREAEILEIRRLASTGRLSQRNLAAIFRVGPPTINGIVTDKTWRHLLPTLSHQSHDSRK